jgi:TolB-like protein
MLRLNLFGRFRAEDSLGKEISIKSRKARALLAYLALPPGKPRSREQLATLLWSDRGDDQARGSLRQALSGLRRDLGDSLAEALRIADDAVSLDPEHVVVESRSPRDELLEGLHINDPAFEEWLRDERLRLEDLTVTEVVPRPLELPNKPSIAVLPFVNMSGEPDQDFFADGITEDIVTALSHISSLFVISRHSTEIYKGKAVDVRDVGQQQGVRYVLEGSVRKANQRIRVTAQLTSGRNDTTESSMTFSRFKTT